MVHQRQVINGSLDLKLARWQEYVRGTGGEVRVGRVVRAGDHNRYLLPVTEEGGPACLGKNYLLSKLIFFASWPKYCRSEWWQIWKWGLLRRIQGPSRAKLVAGERGRGALWDPDGLVDCPTQLIWTWIFICHHCLLCSMTKLKEHSREICY